MQIFVRVPLRSAAAIAAHVIGCVNCDIFKSAAPGMAIYLWVLSTRQVSTVSHSTDVIDCTIQICARIFLQIL